MSEDTRKRIMRCEHPTPCELCLTDCKRAEITAKENEIRSDLLAACKASVRLKDLWCFQSDKPEHQGESEALGTMLYTLEAAIAKATV